MKYMVPIVSGKPNWDQIDTVAVDQYPWGKEYTPQTNASVILWEEGGNLSGARTVSPVLKSYETAQALQNNTVVDKGVFNLMTISQETRVIDNEYYNSYVIVSGSTNFANSLQGKIAGLQVSTGGSSPNSSTQVIIRAISSWCSRIKKCCPVNLANSHSPVKYRRHSSISFRGVSASE